MTSFQSWVYVGCRTGANCCRRFAALTSPTSTTYCPCRRRWGNPHRHRESQTKSKSKHKLRSELTVRQFSNLQSVRRCCSRVNERGNKTVSSLTTQYTPSLYVLNAAALPKSHAVEQLAADLIGNSSDIAVITETPLKVKHTDGVVGIPGYDVFGRDRARRKGGCVALDVRSPLESTVWRYSLDDSQFEI